MLYTHYKGIWYTIDELTELFESYVSKHFRTYAELLQNKNNLLQKELIRVKDGLDAATAPTQTTDKQRIVDNAYAAIQDLLSVTIDVKDSQGERRTTICSVLRNIDDDQRKLDIAQQILVWIEKLVRTDTERGLYNSLRKRYDPALAELNSTKFWFNLHKHELTLGQLYDQANKLKYKECWDDADAIGPMSVWIPIETLLSDAEKRLDAISKNWASTVTGERNFVWSDICHAHYLLFMTRDCMFTYSRSDEEVTIRTGAAIGQVLKATCENHAYVHTNESGGDNTCYTICRYWSGIFRTQAVLKRVKILLSFARRLADTDAEHARIKGLRKKYTQLSRLCEAELNRTKLGPRGWHNSTGSLSRLFEETGLLRDDLRKRLRQ